MSKNLLKLLLATGAALLGVTVVSMAQRVIPPNIVVILVQIQVSAPTIVYEPIWPADVDSAMFRSRCVIG